MPAPKNLPETIARNIKIQLAARGWNASDLAERLGVSRNAVSKWLRGDTDMGLRGLEHVAKMLKIEPAALLASPEAVAENCTRLIC